MGWDRSVEEMRTPDKLRSSELTARPYPAQYVSTWTAPDGTRVTLRPIRPADEPLMIKFHGTLSSRSVSFRYFHAMKLSTRVAHDRLTRICFIDYDREMVLVADRESSVTGEHEILGVGRLNKIPGTSDAEFAILVSDQFQGMGLGTELLGACSRSAAPRISSKFSVTSFPPMSRCSGSVKAWVLPSRTTSRIRWSERPSLCSAAGP